MFYFNKVKNFFTFRNILLVSFYIFIFFIFLHNSYSYLDPDLGWHLQFGKETFESGEVSHIENRNFTLLGKRWVDHEWLLNVIIYIIYSRMGYLWTNLFFAFIAVLTFTIINIFLLKKYKTKIFDLTILLLLELLAVFGILPHFGVRVQEINFLFITLLFFIIFGFEKNKKYIILLFLPPLLFLWSCLHGGFLIGFIVLFIFLCIKILEIILQKFTKIKFIEYNILSIKDLIIFACVSSFSFFLTFLGPYKFELYSFLYQYRDTFYLTHIAEWIPIFYVPVRISQFFYVVVLIAIIFSCIFDVKFKKIKLFEFLISIFFITLSIKSKRHFPLLFIASIFFIYDYLIFFFQNLSNFLSKIYSKTYYIIQMFAIIILIMFSSLFFSKINFTKDPFLSFKNHYPVNMLSCINEQKQKNKRIFVYYGWGGYLIWTLPEVRLFLDGRLPQYPFDDGESILKKYFEFFEKDKSEKLLNKYEIQMVVLKKQEKKHRFNWLESFFSYGSGATETSKNYLMGFLNSSDDWIILCEEKNGIIFIRKQIDI
ncbi:MAG TPA: hypothetical protein PKL13_04795 [bacterium]|nr:hypothetical protein [bacterium]